MSNLRIAYLLFIAATLAMLCYFYYPTILSYGSRWQVSGGTYSHGYPLLLLCILLVLRQISGIICIPPQPFWPAVGLVLVLSMVWLFGRVSDVLVLQQAALPALVLLFVTSLCGLEIARCLRFPFLLFYAAVPLWDALNPVLQWLTVKVCTFGLYIVGIPAFIEENQISIPAGSFKVAGGCSGLSYLLMFGTIGALFGHLYYRNWWHKIMLLVIATVMGLLCNWIRVFSLVIVGQTSNMQSPLLGDHEAMGWIVFALCLLPFFYIASHLEKYSSGQSTDTHSATKVSAKSAWFFAGIAATIAAVMGPLLFRSAAQNTIDGELQIALSNSQSTLIDYAPQPVWSPDYDNFDEHLVLQFPARNPEMLVHMLTYFSQEQGKELIHWSNAIVDKQKWKITAEREWADPAGKKVKLVELQSITGTAELLYWYSVGGFATASPVIGKALQLMAFILGRQDASLLAIFYQCTPNTCEEIRVRASREVEPVNTAYSKAIMWLLGRPSNKISQQR